MTRLKRPRHNMTKWATAAQNAADPLHQVRAVSASDLSWSEQSLLAISMEIFSRTPSFWFQSSLSWEWASSTRPPVFPASWLGLFCSRSSSPSYSAPLKQHRGTQRSFSAMKLGGAFEGTHLAGQRFLDCGCSYCSSISPFQQFWSTQEKRHWAKKEKHWNMLAKSCRKLS